MESIDRDMLRHLTGHGREMARYIDWVIRQYDGGDAPESELPDIRVFHDVDRGYRFEFAPQIKSTETSWGSVEITPTVYVNICIIRSGRREITRFPLRMIISGLSQQYVGKYQVYQHDFMKDAEGNFIEGSLYTGLTKRGWRSRWAQHLSAANSGSHYRFHQAIRQWHDKAKVIAHHVVACGLSESEAMSAEEDLIARETLYPKGLNMIPGGNAGLAYLRRIGALGKNERIAPDDRQDIINRFFERASRKGLPNPLAAANWLDPNYAEKVICAGPDRLKPQQIRDARYFASLGQEAEQIATKIDAHSVAQVKRLLAGETYSRIL